MNRPENLIFSFLGTGHGLQLVVNGEFCIGPQEPHLRARFDREAREDYFFRGMPGDLGAYVNAEFHVERARELLQERGLPAITWSLNPEIINSWLQDEKTAYLSETAKTIFREQGWYLGLLYTVLARIKNQECWSVLISGGRASPEGMPFLWQGIRESLKELSRVTDYPAPVLRPIFCRYQPNCGALGAAYLGLHHRSNANGYDRHASIGIDWGGTNIKVVGIENCNLTYSASLPQDAPNLVKELPLLILEAAYASGVNMKEKGLPIVVGIAGSVTPDGRIVATATNTELDTILQKEIFPLFPAINWIIKHDAMASAWYYAVELGLLD